MIDMCRIIASWEQHNNANHRRSTALRILLLKLS
jgi:hypothetical protein